MIQNLFVKNFLLNSRVKFCHQGWGLNIQGSASLFFFFLTPDPPPAEHPKPRDLVPGRLALLLGGFVDWLVF